MQYSDFHTPFLRNHLVSRCRLRESDSSKVGQFSVAQVGQFYIADNTFDGGSLGNAGAGAFFQLVGHLGKVAKGVKDIALTRNIRPGERLAGTQPPCAIGQRVVRMQALGRLCHQVNRPGRGVSVSFSREQVAIERIEIDPREHRSARLEQLIVATGSGAR